MGIPRRRRTVRRPTRMADANRSENRLGNEQRLEFCDFAGRAACFQRRAVINRDSRRIVTAILHAFQPFDQKGRRLIWSDRADNPAHLFGWVRDGMQYQFLRQFRQQFAATVDQLDCVISSGRLGNHPDYWLSAGRAYVHPPVRPS